MNADHCPQTDLLERIQNFVMDGECGELADRQWAEFEGLLRESDDACRTYAEYMGVYALLRDVLDAAPDDSSPSPNVLAPELPGAVPAFPTGLWHGAVGFFASGWPVAYLIATVVVGLGMLIGAFTYVSRPEQVVQHSPALHSPISILHSVVGSITGMVDCRFAADSKTKDPRPKTVVSLGDKFALTSGLLEITYGTGARVILQGPVTYEIESPAGGFLSVGKLTARVGSSTEYEVRSAEKVAGSEAATIQKFEIRNPNFVVRTPTAFVTDLGTEFSVSVSRDGATDATVHVGSVEMRAIGATGTGNAVRLTERQSARVLWINSGRDLRISRTKTSAAEFVREMPRPSKRRTVPTFSTGVGVREGEPDPHWQIVAVSNDPKFLARPAVVAKSYPGTWLNNDAGESKWISLRSNTAAANDVTYTFRTTFELAGAVPETAVLRGWFTVDNMIRAIRLNGHPVPVPGHNIDKDSFDHFHRFTAKSGFVEGSNVLEIDVENGRPELNEPASPMGLRVDLEATARRKQPEKDP
jgi:hypothetical protein